MRKLTADEVEFVVECEPEYLEIEGNCSAIDEETDKATEKWISSQLRKGNEWAWCSIKVSAHWKAFEGCDYLGGCSYKSQKDFMQPGDYYDDMKMVALEELNKEVAKYAEQLKELN